MPNEINAIKVNNVDYSLRDSSKVEKNQAVTGATKCKITYDSKGLVTGGANLEASDIPSLSAGKITSGTFDTARIPSLAASKITSGTFDAARIPDLSSTYSVIGHNHDSFYVTDVAAITSVSDRGCIEVTKNGSSTYIKVDGWDEMVSSIPTTYAGSSSAGGAATSAAKLTNTSKIGDTNKPVYFTANGVPAAISYTIGTNVPSDAVFTDTNYYHTPSYSSGVKIATGTGRNDLYVPTGTAATNVAIGNHTHTITLATDSGTPTVTLSHNTTYKLTAGGNSVIFKTPSDNNTNYYHTPVYTSGGLKIGTGTGVSDMYVPNGSTTAAGVLQIGTSASNAAAGNHNHDSSYLGKTATAADSSKLNGQSASYYATSTHNHDSTYLKLAGGNMTGHIYLTGATSNSTLNTSQLVFGTSSSNHVAISSNDKILIINPTTTTTTGQILLQVGSSPSIKVNGTAVSLSGHTHSYAGSSSAGGAATSANKLNTDAGSTIQPVYFSNGIPVATSFSLAKSVPSDAKFTDTNTWRNVKVDSTEKLGTGTGTGSLNFISQTTNNGDVSFTYDGGIKATAKLPTFATVATSGSYNDLSNKPSIPSKDSDLSTNDRYVRFDTSSQGLSSTQKSNARTNIGAGTSSFSGNYNDLTNKPTIPAAQVNSDWNASSGVAQILNKPTLATVATSGSYNDLSNKPTIPTDTNQKIKADTVTFGNNDVVNIVAGDNVTVTGLASGTGAPKITISATDTDTGATSVGTTGSGNVFSSASYDSSTRKITFTKGVTALTSHQSIKSLDTTATTAQSTNSSEAIAGSGTITLHKIAKTGTYSDLIGKPTIPATNVIPATTTANKMLVSTTTSGTAKWSDWSSAGFLKTNTSGVISVDTNSYLTTSGTAADSSKLNGQSASYYQVALPTTTTAGKVLKSTSTAGTVEWGNDSNTNTWRNVKVDSTEQLGTGTGTGALNFISQTTNNGDVSFTYDDGIKATAKLPTFATVATSGSYNDLSNKPTIPATNVIPATTTGDKLLVSTTTSGTAKWSNWSSAGFVKTNASGVVSIDTTTYLTSHQSIKSLDTTATTTQSTNASEAIKGSGTITLHKVSKTGKYSDLIGTPTLATVATSGLYSDLSGTPTIPTVNNGTLTIQKNGSSVGTFNANQSSSTTINITVPTIPSDIGAATSGHTHSLTLATDTGTPTITLAHNTTYKLTAGGSAIIFKLPSDSNTNYYHNPAYSSGLKIGTGVGVNDMYVPNGSTTTAGVLQIGTSASNAAAGNHNHTISLATSSSTPTITLSNSATYALTAGGQTVIFKTPAGGSGGSTLYRHNLEWVFKTGSSSSGYIYTHFYAYLITNSSTAYTYSTYFGSINTLFKKTVLCGGLYDYSSREDYGYDGISTEWQPNYSKSGSLNGVYVRYMREGSSTWESSTYINSTTTAYSFTDTVETL